LAKLELTQSPLYENLLLSPDARTTAIQIVFQRDETYFSLLDRRNQLLADKDADKEALKKADYEFDTHKKYLVERDRETIAKLRSILAQFQDRGSFVMGGASMISSDITDFIAKDLKIFGGSIIVFIVATLILTFRRVVWVLIPLISCVFNAIIVTGLIAFLAWEVSIISSNYISLLMILTMSICVHLIVRYRELSASDLGPDDVLYQCLSSMIKPCFYTTLTTVIAFVSLSLSGIKPVITFGWIMMASVSLALIISLICFTFFAKYFQ